MLRPLAHSSSQSAEYGDTPTLARLAVADSYTDERDGGRDGAGRARRAGPHGPDRTSATAEGRARGRKACTGPRSWRLEVRFPTSASLQPPTFNLQHLMMMRFAENRVFVRVHDLRVVRLLVVVAEEVQDAVHEQVRDLVL